MRATNSFYEYSGGLLRRIYDRRISGPPVLDPVAYFPASKGFAAAWRPLRDEALSVARNLPEVPRFHELMPQQAEISANDDRDWRMLVVKAYGVLVPRNAARCPALTELVSSAPEVLSAALSFLAPRKHVSMHRGPFRGVIRFYLGLSVPLATDGLPGTSLVIDGRAYRIGDGQCLLWDDTFAHEVRNDTEELRVALLLDIRRRGMPLDMEMLSRLVIAAARTIVRLRLT
jgi:aspartate beta-hydroxylase